MVSTHLFILLPERHCFIFMYAALSFPVLSITRPHLYVTKCKCLHYPRCVLPMRIVIVLHNIHIHYLEVKDDAPWQLVMFVHLVGLCFPPLQMVCLACKYFKLSVN